MHYLSHPKPFCTHTYICGLWGLSIGVMVFTLTVQTAYSIHHTKPTHHRKPLAFFFIIIIKKHYLDLGYRKNTFIL